MKRLLLLLILFTALSAACRQNEGMPSPGSVSSQPPAESTSDPVTEATEPQATPTREPEPTATVTPTPLPPKDLTVCVSGEPTGIYLYGDGSAAARAIRQAIYEPPVTSLGYEYQALALEKLPSLADGDARLEPVEVGEGTLVVNAAEQIAPLIRGMEVIDVTGQPVIFDGTPVRMNQLVVEFTFKPLVWSDGQPVTAEDSIFSFRIAGDRNTPQLDDQVRYTVAYEAIGDRSVRWTGLPGYVDPAYMAHVWTPLPSHQLGEYAPAELVTLDETVRNPLSYGAFVVDEWAGDSLRLVPNPHYYRADEGLPHLTSLTYRFLESVPGALPGGYEDCHILTSDLLVFDNLPALDEAVAAGEVDEHITSAGVVEQVIFGIDSSAAYEATRVNWFQDARVRQAITQCIDRKSLVDELTYGRAAVMDTFVPPDHTMRPEDLPQWPHDPVAANALLDEVGYLDQTGDGIREDITTTAPFSITIGTNAGSPMRQQITERVRDDLVACGIQASAYTLEAGAWFAPGPAGTVFGRKFDLAQFAWLSRIEPDCGLYLSAHIPGPVDGGFIGWQGVNVSGWSNEAFDAACGRALSLLPGQPGYVESHQEAMRIFAQELPAIPLFTRLRLAATTPNVLNFRLDPTQPSEMWNVYELDIRLDGR